MAPHATLAAPASDVTKLGAPPLPPPASSPPPPADGAAAADPAALASLAAGFGAAPKHLPCSFLYDDVGSAIYDEIVALPEYYPFAAERRVLAASIPAIVASLPAGAVLVELGCGTAEKTGALVAALAAARGAGGATYVGTDCSPAFLAAAAANLAAAAPGADVHTVCTLYEGAGGAAAALFPGAPLAFLWLGSSVGNLAPADAAALVKGCLSAGGPGSVMLLATDLWKGEDKLRPAYDDAAGVTARFARNGVAHALAALPGALAAARAAGADPSTWPYTVTLNEREERVEMWVTCPAAFATRDVAFAAGERVLVELSRKFTPARVAALAAAAGARVSGAWGDEEYALQLLERQD